MTSVVILCALRPDLTNPDRREYLTRLILVPKICKSRGGSGLIYSVCMIGDGWVLKPQFVFNFIQVLRF